VKPFGLGNKEALRCKNMWTLGLALWMFDREREPIVALAERTSSPRTRAGRGQHRRAQRRPCLWRDGRDRPGIAQASIISTPRRRARALSHRHRRRGHRLGLVAGAQLAGLPMFFGGYPITPASAILHNLVKMKEFGVTTFQAEDEIAAICAAIGASYAGSLASPRRPAPASRSRARRWALRS
jgi:2-oxoglutarate ferredoxin oxidoreductase subunit alpha